MPVQPKTQNFFTKSIIVFALVAGWEIYARHMGNDLLLPSFTQTLEALITGILNGVILSRLWGSLSVLFIGFAIGVALAAILASLASTSRLGERLLEVLTSIFNPLPAIALLPIALLWFGLGTTSLVFVLVHSVLWTMALNMHYGFKSISPTLRMVGHNLGMNRLRYTISLLIPAAFPGIFSGLKISWAFAWRTLIAAELIFGVSSGEGGIGWFIYESRNMMETANVFAGLLAIIIVGVITETLIFNAIERRTIKKWGMVN